MQLTIIGLPKSGKTTIFNALSAGSAPTSAYSATQAKPNLGVAKVPDPRMIYLTARFNPKKILPAEVHYVDLPASAKGFGTSEGIGGQFLLHLQQADAILHVARAFEDPSLPHSLGSVSAERDIATLDIELSFSDLAVLERRVQRLKEAQKGNKPQEREAAARELVLASRIKEALEQEKPVRQQQFTEEESKTLANYGLLTAKPLLVVVNIGEESIADSDKIEKELRAKFASPSVKLVVISGKIEAELAQMGEADAKEFRASLGTQESGLSKVIRSSYELLGLQTFFTVGPDEVRAWTITTGMVAQKAAGKIHSDIERGFIRAEVLGYDDFVKLNAAPRTGEKSFVEARKRGVLRQEGKTYVVKDGDIIEFLHNE
ncbi:MAG: redox-regulated ATPase YchF [Dehalococcoidia bacterium]|nr:redox-regulated ATPase YchF [Dehalococcoidia bacterium]